MVNRTEHDSLTRLSTAELKWRVLNGDSYSAGELFTDVTGGNTKQLYLENPTSDTHYAVSNILARSEGKITVYKSFNVTEDTEGDNTSTGVQNKRSSGGGSSEAIARIGGNGETGAYSGGRELSTKTAGRAGNPNQIQPGDSPENGVSNAIDPGDNMCLFVTNDTTSENDISIDIDWVEMPGNDYP